MVDQHLSRWHFQASKIGKIGKWYEVRLCLRLCPLFEIFGAWPIWSCFFSCLALCFFCPMAQRERTCNIIRVSTYNWIAPLSSSTQHTAHSTHTDTCRSEKGEVLSHPFPDRSASSLMRPYHFHHPSHESLSHPPNASSIHFGVSRLRGWERSNLLVGLHGQS